MSNRESCPAACCFLVAWAASTIGSKAASSPRRVWPRSENAPALIRFSRVFLLRTLPSTLSQKSRKSVNLPFSVRARAISATMPSPTPRTADSPKRMSSPTGVKSDSDSLTSGGSTEMPMRRHSLR